MPDLSTKYLGLELKNPLIVSSSSLTQTLESIKRCEEAGAGAIVLKSLFEEQIEAEIEELEKQSDIFSHPEALDYIRQTSVNMGPGKYLDLIENAKNTLSIPIIASLNAVTSKGWADFSKRIEDEGADAIELNIAIMPSSPNSKPEEIENTYLDIVETIKSKTSLPIAVKIGPYFTALPNLARRLSYAGADAIVLFNRFYQLDIDIDSLKLKAGYRFSSPNEIYTPLRWISVLYDRVECQLSATTGVHEGEGFIKMLLAGATTVQVCSTLYMNKLDRISEILNQLEGWMDSKAYSKIEDFRGLLSMSKSKQPDSYERLQYIKALVGIE